jgi:hypothetical protein
LTLDRFAAIVADQISPVRSETASSSCGSCCCEHSTLKDFDAANTSLLERRQLVMRYLLILAALLGLMVSTGCIGSTLVQGQQGKAYVVNGSIFGTSVWNCEATGGKPKCYKVIKQ